MPSSIPEKKGGFLLRSGNRHPEVFILANPKRRRREIAEQTTNFFLGDWPPLDIPGRTRLLAIGKNCKRTNVIAPDGARRL